MLTGLSRAGGGNETLGLIENDLNELEGKLRERKFDRFNPRRKQNGIKLKAICVT